MEATKPTLKLFVPGKPVSVNRLYRRAGTRVFRSADAVHWKEAVTWTVYAAGARGLFTKPAISYVFQGVKGDVDNYLKIVNDAIQAALDVNDKHFRIASASVERAGEPGVWLEIQEGEA